MRSKGRPATALPAELLNLQVMRGLAACMVVIYHASQVWADHTGAARVWGNGSAGVDLFFVISGLVMMLATRTDAQARNPARRFLERRVVRVMPLYWIVTALTLMKLGMVALHPQFENSAEHVVVSRPYLVSSLLLIPFRNSLGAIQPLVYVGWTLSYEMFFYLLFAGALAFHVKPVKLLTPVMFGLVVLGRFRSESWPAFTVLASPLLLEFLAGVWLGWALKRGLRLPAGVAGAVGLAGLIAILTVPLPAAPLLRPLAWGLPALMTIGGAVLMEGRLGFRIPGWLLLAGDASYSIYLFHPTIFTFGVKALQRMGMMRLGRVSVGVEAGSVAMLVVGSVVAGMVLYRLVEKPVNDALRKRLRLRRVQTASAG